MSRKVIFTEKAPAVIGPYSQGITFQKTIFCAGQIPLDPSTGKLVEGGIREQVVRILENLKAVLVEGGSSLDRVLRLDVYMTDLSLFPEVNECLAQVFTDEPPARVTVEVSGLPMGAEVEIAAIAGKR
jgi:2-iminobutanoate/2-iminopropanoate deaminase